MRPRLRLSLLLITLGTVAVLPARGQELLCAVNLNYSQLGGTEYTFLEDLRNEIRAYMNTQQWTDHRFQEGERIDCQILITLLEAPTLTSFNARIVVVGARPIYGTQSNTTTVQLSDGNWQFNYAQGTPLIRNFERFDALTSVLDYYAFILLGYDYDSFSQLGGTPYFDRARRIAELAQTAPGWSDLASGRSRLDLITQILDPRFESFRRAFYQYHIGGLDLFLIETEESRANILETLTNLELLFEQFNRQYLLDVFFSTKSSEIVGVFERSSSSDQAYALLSTVDPANLSTYEKLLE